MKKLLIIALFTFVGISCYGQNLPWFLNRDTTHNNAVLYILFVQGKPPLQLFGYDFNVDPKSLTNIDVITGTEAVKLYGQAGRYGAINLYCKKDTKIILKKLSSLTEIYNNYKINLKDRTLPIYIDSSLIIHPELQYLNSDKIKSVKVDTEFVSGIRFISVITIHPPKEHPKPGEIWIRGTYAKQ